MPGVTLDDQIVLEPDEVRDNPVLDEMLRDGLRKRDEVLGQDYFARLKEWWNFRLGITSSARTPTFRPNIMMSDLQWMTIQEAGDLTDNSPMPVIYEGIDEMNRRPEHEKALRGQWYVGGYSHAFYKAALEAQLCGTGVLMMAHDYAGRSGRGNTLLKCIDTENFIVDPAATSAENWGYVIYRSRLSLDEIRRRFPKWATDRLPKFPSSASMGVPKIGQQSAESADQMRMPPGPMQQMSFGPLGSGQSTRIVEYIFVLDDGRKIVQDIDGTKTKALLVAPKTVPAYPTGRLIVRCDRMKLFDGPQPYKRFPFTPVQVHPARGNFWAPPPVRYVIQLQEIAQTLMRQNVENGVRLNNGLVLINEAAGIKADEVLGLPGERIKVSSPDGVDKALKILTPPAFPSDLFGLPDKLLEKMKLQYGFNDTRAGQTNPGNQSKGMYETSLSQASGLTQVRARLMQPAVKLAMEMVYETMLQYQNPVMFPLPNEQTKAMEFVKWAGAQGADLQDWELMVDPSSIKAMSSAMARQYALLLRNAGLLDVQSTLEAIGWPGADVLAKKIEQEQALAMLAKQDQRGNPRRKTG